MSGLQKLAQHSTQAQILEAQIHTMAMVRAFTDANDSDLDEMVADKKRLLQFELDAIKHIAASL